MAVYFLTELENSLHGEVIVKIGRSQLLKRRIANLQTGNHRKIALMGEIRTRSIPDDRAVERQLHIKFEDKAEHGEWFSLSPEDVVSALKHFSSIAYIAVGQDAFEIISYDRKAVPEFASPWLWGELDFNEFCPICGWAGGWSYSENHAGDICLECGTSEHEFNPAEYNPENG
ncbi:GIY-YIG nuclease family protein [Parasedimentitalea maritima]|uniref:GIY-YIG nuclease family protein n=1 Tax=Parasedimentitalea maritima TaxID=2578117 RepID=A0A6A4RF36_9RHOB|nr:GIY-YIG nuclease family protein [Zongyanglinia marina]KAE9627947.1 GIY-YIG nuclease family protein [Zongyanglinia marina]